MEIRAITGNIAAEAIAELMHGTLLLPGRDRSAKFEQLTTKTFSE